MDKKVSILINSLYSGGAETVVLALLRKMKFNPSITLILLENIVFYDIPQNVRVIYISKKAPQSGIIKLIMLPVLSYRLKKIILTEKIELVQSHMFRANYVNILSKMMGSNHIVQIVNHIVASPYKLQGILGKTNIFLIKHLYPIANLVLNVSQGVKNDIMKLLSKYPKMDVIYNPFDIDFIISKSAERFEQNELKWNESKEYIICMGRMVNQKRHDILIHAFNKVASKLPNCELIFLGDGPEQKKLVELTEKLSLSSKIHFQGFVKNPFKYLKKASLNVLSSEFEGFGNTLVESMICKCPVISTDCPYGPREILNGKYQDWLLNDKIEYAKYGVLVPPGNIDLLAEAMHRMIMDKELREKYINSGFVRSKDFDIKQIVTEYHNRLVNKMV